MGSVPGWGRYYMLQSNWACVPRLLSLYSRTQEPQLLSPHAARVASRSLQLDKSLHSNRDPAQPKTKQINTLKKPTSNLQAGHVSLKRKPALFFLFLSKGILSAPHFVLIPSSTARGIYSCISSSHLHHLYSGDTVPATQSDLPPCDCLGHF